MAGRSLTLTLFALLAFAGPAQAQTTTPGTLGGPTVSITSPGAGTVGGSVDYVAAADSSSGIAAVEFYVDGTLRSVDRSAPFAYKGTGRWNTAAETDGPHVLSVRAIDALGATASDSRAVTVDHAASPTTGTLWSGDFSTGDLTQWDAVHAAAPDRIQVVGSPTHGRRYAARFEARPGDVVDGGERAEVLGRNRTARSGWTWPDPPGSERWYGWSTYFPEDYLIAEPWQTVSQWHVNGFGASPLAMRVEGSHFMLEYRPQASDSYPIWDTAVDPGHWHDFVLHVRWSSDASVGFVELWHDGQLAMEKSYRPTLFVSHSGADAGQDRPAYWTQGMYHSKAIGQPQAIYHANARVGLSYEDVEPYATDSTPPDTSVDGGPAGPTNNSDASFRIGSSEPDSSFDCKLDGQDWAPCQSPFEAHGLADGDHVLAVRATDPAGNVDETPARRSWTVDTAPPDTALQASPDATRFAFSSSEPGSSFECALDDASWQQCESPADIEDVPAGQHKFAVRAVDGAGNRDASPATYTWTAGQGPTVSLLGPSSSATGFTDFLAGADDPDGVDRVEFFVDGELRSVDRQAPYAYKGSGRWNAGAEAPGPHVLKVRAFDGLGNHSSATANVVTSSGAGASAVLWDGGFDGGTLTQWSQMVRSSSDRLTVVAAPGGRSGKAGRFEARGTGSQRRADLGTDPQPEGSDRYYGWATYVAANYPLAAGSQDFTYWYVPEAKATPLALRAVGDQLALVATSGNRSTVLWHAPFDRGRWHEFVLRVRWSPSAAQGLVELWHDGELVLPPTPVATEPAGQSAPPMLWHGINRVHEVTPTQVVYHADLKVGQSYEAVDP